jgi:hypothetical protein
VQVLGAAAISGVNTGDLWNVANTCVYVQDWLESTGLVLPWTVVSSAGSNAYMQAGTAGHPGLCRFDTGTTAGNWCGAYNAGSSILLAAGTVFEFLVNLNLDSTGTVFRFGLSNWTTGTGAPTSGVFFEYDKASSANWRIRSGSASTYTTTTSGTAAAFNAWSKLRLTYDGTTLTFILNGAILGTITTNIPSAAMHLWGFATQNTINSFTYADVDYVAFSQTGLNR